MKENTFLKGHKIPYPVGLEAILAGLLKELLGRNVNQHMLNSQKFAYSLHCWLKKKEQ